MRIAFCAALLAGTAAPLAVSAAPPAVSAAPPAGDRTTGASVADAWVVPPVLASGARLPVPSGATVIWQADGRPLRDAVLVNPAARPVTVRLTGTLTAPGRPPVTKRFTVRVLAQDAPRLFAYARTPTGVSDANQPIIARSVHLALGPDRAHAVPLNGDYGALFAIGDYVAVDRVEPRGVADPSPFYFADGSLGIIGTRVLLSGEPDPQHPAAAIVFRADPQAPADFTELGLLDLPATGTVSAPRAVWDSAARRYIVSWQNAGGASAWTAVQDLARTQQVPTAFFPEHRGLRSRIVAAGNVGARQAGAIPVDAGLPLDAATVKALNGRFGRIVNTAAAVAPMTIRAGQVDALTAARATLHYSDGSTASRAVDWTPAELQRLRSAAPGTYLLHGTVRQPAYPQIFAYNRADPTIFRYDQGGRTRYLFIATDDTNNDNVGSPHLPIRVADTIAGLADANGGVAREVDLLNRLTRRDRTAEGRTIAGCYWAPELHMIGGRLSILFAPCFNAKDDRSNTGGLWSTVESHIMQLRSGGDPGNPADWSTPAAVRRADGSRLGRPEFAQNISLDMSYFEVGGQAYYTWSQRYLPASGPLGDPLTWIAKVDPAHPTRLTSPPRPIIAPNLAFEENLAEGAFALQHEGRIHLIYSGSGVSPTYVVGGAWARADADLTDIESWHRWKAPLQKSQPMPAGVTDYRTYEQGPGHGAFTTDEDGNTLYVYHSWGNGVGGDGRDTRVRRLHWAADGRPVLDMMPDEEVAPASRAVTMRVIVTRP